MDSLELILVAGLIGMALVNAASLVWAFYLDGRLRQRPVPKHYDIHIDGSKIFSEVDLAAVEVQAREQLKKSAEEAAKKLQESVAENTNDIAGRLKETADEALQAELEKYRINLEELHTSSINQFSEVQKEVDDKRIELLKELDADITKERERRMDKFNERINDVVANYLAESLGNQVDLGAQGRYILRSLQEHKDEIKRDVLA